MNLNRERRRDEFPEFHAMGWRLRSGSGIESGVVWNLQTLSRAAFTDSVFGGKSLPTGRRIG